MLGRLKATTKAAAITRILRQLCERVNNYQGFGPTGSQEQFDRLFQFFQALYRREHGMKGQTIRPVTIQGWKCWMERSMKEKCEMDCKTNSAKAVAPKGLHPAIVKPLEEELVK